MANEPDEFSALQAVIQALQPFDPDDRGRILQSAATFLRISIPGLRTGSSGLESHSLRGDSSHQAETTRNAYPPFSTPDDTSPKDFLFEKQPRTDVERIAVLAFFLTHYMATPHFKTLELSKLNTEAAQPKFANAATSASNAVKQGYLVPSTKGMRQLSAAGERFVAALPDREAAKVAMEMGRPKRRQQRKSPSTGSNVGAGAQK